MNINFWVEEVERLVREGMSIRKACWKVKCWRLLDGRCTLL